MVGKEKPLQVYRRSQVAVLFSRLGPYHQARLRAASRLADLKIIQSSEQDDTYAWDKLHSDPVLQVETLFHDGDAANQPVGELVRRFSSVMQERKPDVVLVPGWSSRLALITLIWCCRNRIPTVLMSESTAWDERRGPMKEWVKRQVVRAFSAALAGGTPHRDYLVQLGMPIDRVFLGYDTVDNNYFAHRCEEVRNRRSETRKRHGLPEKYFLAVARFVEKKNLLRLLQAYVCYRKQNPHSLWHLVLIGD